jgi:hypothetical protein
MVRKKATLRQIYSESFRAMCQWVGLIVLNVALPAAGEVAESQIMRMGRTNLRIVLCRLHVLWVAL